MKVQPLGCNGIIVRKRQRGEEKAMRLLNPENMRTLAAVALGEEEADLVVKNADLVNVYTRELLRGTSVAVKGEWIAYVGPDAGHTIGRKTQVIEAEGQVLMPGLVDGHTHILYYAGPHEFLRYAMTGGTTTFITEIMELTFPLGYEGLLSCLEAFKDQPVKIFSTVPPSITLSRDAAERAPKPAQLMDLLNREEVLGVGEGFWQEVLQKKTNYPTLAAEALRLRKTVEGHAAGCRSRRLPAYLDYGVSSCHESVSADEVVEKIRLGVCAMIREGSIRKELDAIGKIKDLPLDLRRVALVTDGTDPRDLVEKGYLEHVVQRAVDVGFDPILAVQMATLNVAEHFRLDGLLGGIAPGKYADMVLIPDLRTIRAECVVSNGVVIARKGKRVVEPRRALIQGDRLEKRRFTPGDFAVRVDRNGSVRVRVIDQVTELVTKGLDLEMPVHDGEIQADPKQDLLKASIISCEGRIFTALIRGHGFRAGAMATSIAWETFSVVVVGVAAADMAAAANRVYDMGGGVVIWAQGGVQAELPLPIAGFLSELTMEEVVRRLKSIQEKAEALGFPFADAGLTLATLTTAAIPFLRLSEDGLVDVKTGRVVEMIVP
jgi:adenine deaminase